MEQKPKVIAIVQARMASTRFPGKVLAEIAGRPMLCWVVERLRRVGSLDVIVVATSTEGTDDPIVEACSKNAIDCFRGSHADVLDRYYKAAKNTGAEVVVRITADCPLIDPQVVDRVVRAYLAGGYDYVTNTLQYTYPDGLDTEVFSFGALERAWQEARLPADREHVTPYIRVSGRFQTHNVQNDVNLSSRDLRWTVDEPADLEFVRAVYSRLGENQRPFGMSEVLKMLDKEPFLKEINRGKVREEGYYRSLATEPAMPAHNRSLRRSYELKEKAKKIIPSCTQTFSKGPTQFVQGVAPVFLRRGSGSHVFDVDGNEYIDYAMALGPVILGYNYPAVTEAVMRQMRDGTTFSLPHPLEVEVAEMLVAVIPCAESVRFGKSGSDATSGAVRLARAYTGRELIACCGYHGWQDWYIGTTTRNKGVPKSVQALTIPFEYNRIDTLERIFNEHANQVAAVIMEPVGVVEPEVSFLQTVKEVTHKNGALLIFDEVVTGFRLALGGAQEYFGVTPDLACLGKAMANGFPLSAVVGPREIMELFDDAFFSFTFGGEAVSLAASLATIKEMQEQDVILRLWDQGQKLKDGYNVLAREFGLASYTRCVGLAPHSVMSFSDRDESRALILRSLLQQELIKRGVLFLVGNNLCYSHSDADVNHTLRAYRAALEIMAKAIEGGDPVRFLEGEPVQPVFRKA